MARFSGEVGFGTTVKTAPGVFDEQIVERLYYGDVIRNTRRQTEGENLQNDITTGNSISIVADAYANENFFAIRYVRWMGVLWKLSDVEVQAPRLILRLGGKYNGPTV